MTNNNSLFLNSLVSILNFEELTVKKLNPRHQFFHMKPSRFIMLFLKLLVASRKMLCKYEYLEQFRFVVSKRRIRKWDQDFHWYWSCHVPRWVQYSIFSALRRKRFETTQNSLISQFYLSKRINEIFELSFCLEQYNLTKDKHYYRNTLMPNSLSYIIKTKIRVRFKGLISQIAWSFLTRSSVNLYCLLLTSDFSRTL